MNRRARIAGGCAFALGLLLAPARSQPASDPLTGIWASELSFTPGLQGALTITRSGSNWRAALAAATADFQAKGNELRFAFSGNRGSFRGTLTNSGQSIQGFWLQPAGDTHDPRDPGGSGQAFASPLVMNTTGPDAWRGNVVPLADRFTLYLKIFQDTDGSLTGAFRNPEMNSRGGAGQFHVTQKGDDVLFNAQPDPAAPEIRLSATIFHAPDRLQIHWPDLGRTIELVRQTPSEAASFFPRPPGNVPYMYDKPAVTGDGWQTARARDVGMDEPTLAHLVQRLIDGDPAAKRPALIHSLLIAHRGKLVLEQYFFGFDRDQPHDLRSAGKTFASVMLGAALMSGARLAPETPIYGLLAAMGPFANPDPRKAQITLAYLMTHTSGLACDDNDDNSPGNEETTQSQSHQPNWWKYTLDLPVAHDPGSRYAYCSAGMNLVGAALTTATSTWLPDLFERTVARPLRFGPYYWNLMPNGEGYLGGGAYVRPRDLLKLGQAYLDGGVWNGHRIVAASWVARSTSQRVEVSEATTGLDSQQFPQSYIKGADGYAWHLSTLQSGARAYNDYAATGNGGQFLIVVPDLDLAVVFTAGNYTQGGIWGHFRDQILPQEIIPAIRQ